MQPSTISLAANPERGSRSGSTEPSEIGLEAERRLRSSGYLVLRAVVCRVSAGVLRLHGRLPSYYLKQVAQTIAADVEGVRRVVNLIEVIPSAGRPPQGQDHFVETDEPTPFGQNLQL